MAAPTSDAASVSSSTSPAASFSLPWRTWSAAVPACAAAAALSKLKPSGSGTQNAMSAAVYSAQTPMARGPTSGTTATTFVPRAKVSPAAAPACSTVPAQTVPSTRAARRLGFPVMSASSPRTNATSAGVRQAARTCTSTSLSRISGTGSYSLLCCGLLVAAVTAAAVVCVGGCWSKHQG